LKNQSIVPILDLIDERKFDSAVYLLRDSHYSVLNLMENTILMEYDDKKVKNYLKVYHSVLREDYSNILAANLQANFIDIERLFLHINCFFFGAGFFESKRSLDRFLNPIISKLAKSLIGIHKPEEVLGLFHEHIADRFIIDATPHSVGFIGGIEQQTLSQFEVSILYLIVARRLDIPIFGLPLDDKMVLCYAKRHCFHDECVFEEDVLNYLIVGEKDIIYAPLDLILLSMIQEEPLLIQNKLPRSNACILNSYMDNLVSMQEDAKYRDLLSSKYQQIQLFSTEIAFL
jgi:hypothetical protein